MTDTLIDTYKPTWNQVITPAGMTVSASTLMSNSPTWQIWVGDDDGCSPSGDDCTGRRRVHDPPDDHGVDSCGAVSWWSTNRQSCAQVTLDFVCQPPLAGTP